MRALAIAAVSLCACINFGQLEQNAKCDAGFGCPGGAGGSGGGCFFFFFLCFFLAIEAPLSPPALTAIVEAVATATTNVVQIAMRPKTLVRAFHLPIRILAHSNATDGALINTSSRMAALVKGVS